MQITSFAVHTFRNIAAAQLTPGPGVNVVCGDNGQGKTNLLEAIWLMTGLRSFRRAEYGEMIKEGEEASCVSAAFISNEREQSGHLKLSPHKRLLTLNGFAQETPRRMLGVFPAVAFTPGTLALAQGGPGERRRFLDVALSMRTPAYAVRLSKYLKALAQRNALLRADHAEDLLDTWDLSLAGEAARIAEARAAYLGQLIPRTREFYTGISNRRETLDASYHVAGTKEITEEGYLAALRRNRNRDTRLQMTHAGPHRDDLLLTLNGKSLRDFGSQGQQRSAALALKLAEAAVLFETTGERPVALLDDVMSELDPNRQRDLLRYLDGWQIFLTCCEYTKALQACNGKVFEVKGGQFEEREVETIHRPGCVRRPA